MSTHEVSHIDRDPKTGHFLPGHSVANLAQKRIAQRMAELRAAYLEAVSPEDAAKVYHRHMELVLQTRDDKLALAAIHEWYNRHFGKAVESVNITTDSRPPAPVLNVTPEQVKVLQEVMAANTPKPVKAGSV